MWTWWGSPGVDWRQVWQVKVLVGGLASGCFLIFKTMCFPVSWLALLSIKRVQWRQTFLPDFLTSLKSSILNSCVQEEQVKVVRLVSSEILAGFFSSVIVLLRVWFLLCKSSLVLVSCLIFWLASVIACSVSWLSWIGWLWSWAISCWAWSNSARVLWSSVR